MNKEQLIAYFNENRERMIDDIKTVAVWSNDPDKKACATIEAGLRILISEGDNEAAALYCIIAVNDNHGKSFSEEVVQGLLMDNAIRERYLEMVEEEFGEIVDDEQYRFLCAYPCVSFFGRLIRENEGADEAPDTK